MTCCECKAKLDRMTAIRGKWCGAPCYPPLEGRRPGGWDYAIPLTSVAGFNFTRRAA